MKNNIKSLVGTTFQVDDSTNMSLQDYMKCLGDAIHESQGDGSFSVPKLEKLEELYTLFKLVRQTYPDSYNQLLSGWDREERGNYKNTEYVDATRIETRKNSTEWTSYFKDAMEFGRTKLLKQPQLEPYHHLQISTPNPAPDRLMSGSSDAQNSTSEPQVWLVQGQPNAYYNNFNILIKAIESFTDEQLMDFFNEHHIQRDGGWFKESDGTDSNLAIHFLVCREKSVDTFFSNNSPPTPSGRNSAPAQFQPVSWMNKSEAGAETNNYKLMEQAIQDMSNSDLYSFLKENNIRANGGWFQQNDSSALTNLGNFFLEKRGKTPEEFLKDNAATKIVNSPTTQIVSTDSLQLDPDKDSTAISAKSLYIQHMVQSSDYFDQGDSEFSGMSNALELLNSMGAYQDPEILTCMTQIEQALDIGKGKIQLPIFSMLQDAAISENILNKLKAGETVLLHSGMDKHLSFIELKPSQNGSFDINIYNSGHGLKHHDFDVNQQKFRTVLTVRNVTLKDGQNGLNIKELKKLLTLTNSNTSQFRNIDTLYEWAKEKGNVDKENGKLHSEQKVGNCVSESVFAYLKQNLPDKKYLMLRTEIFKRLELKTRSKPLKKETNIKLKRKYFSRLLKLNAVHKVPISKQDQQQIRAFLQEAKDQNFLKYDEDGFKRLDENFEYFLKYNSQS